MSAVRRKDAMGREGMLAANEGAVGWRASQLSKGTADGASLGVGILQLLTPEQAKLVPILGQKSSWDESYCKKTECAKELGSEQGWVTTPGR